MTKEIYENSVLDDSAEAIEEQETELCEDAARNVIGVVTDCLKLNIQMCIRDRLDTLLILGIRLMPRS